MSTEEIKLLESIRDGMQVGFKLVATEIGYTNDRLDQTNAKLGQVEGGLGSRLDETNARLGTLETTCHEHSVLLRRINTGLSETNVRLGSVESRVSRCETGIDAVHGRLDTLNAVLTRDYQSLTIRLDKLEETG